MGVLIDLETLLKEGIKGFSNYKPREQEKIRKEILKMDVTTVPCLTMVNKFVEDNIIKNDSVRKFCLDYIFEAGVFHNLKSYENRIEYSEDKEVLASIRCYYFGQDQLDQFWFLLQFLIFYVEALTTNVPQQQPSVRDQLLSLSDSIKSLKYPAENWKTSAPQHTGKISLFVDNCRNPKISITDYRVLHYLSKLIKTHFEKAKDPDLDNILFVETKDYIEVVNYGWNVVKNLQEDNKPRNNIKTALLSVSDKGFYEKIEKNSDNKKLIIFASFFFEIIEKKVETEGKKEPQMGKTIKDFYPDYCKKDPITGHIINTNTLSVITNKWVLLSKLIYRLNYYSEEKEDAYNKYYDVDTKGNNNTIRNNIHKEVKKGNTLDVINPTRTISL